MTFPVDYNHHASAGAWLGEPAHDPKEVSYKEDIYVGYRYFNTFDIPVSYAFGYGLSYTTFEYSNLTLSTTNFKDKAEVSVRVTNTGDKTGKEVVQLYLTAPEGTINKPSAELKAFGKTKDLKPGESQTLTFTLTPKLLASFIDEQSAWVAEKGKYVVHIGASSRDMKLDKTFSLSQDIIAEKTGDHFGTDIEVETLKY